MKRVIRNQVRAIEYGMSISSASMEIWRLIYNIKANQLKRLYHHHPKHYRHLVKFHEKHEYKDWLKPSRTNSLTLFNRMMKSGQQLWKEIETDNYRLPEYAYYYAKDDASYVLVNRDLNFCLDLDHSQMTNNLTSKVRVLFKVGKTIYALNIKTAFFQAYYRYLEDKFEKIVQNRKEELKSVLNTDEYQIFENWLKSKESNLYKLKRFHLTQNVADFFADYKSAIPVKWLERYPNEKWGTFYPPNLDEKVLPFNYVFKADKNPKIAHRIHEIHITINQHWHISTEIIENIVAYLTSYPQLIENTGYLSVDEDNQVSFIINGEYNDRDIAYPKKVLIPLWGFETVPDRNLEHEPENIFEYFRLYEKWFDEEAKRRYPHSDKKYYHHSFMNYLLAHLFYLNIVNEDGMNDIIPLFNKACRKTEKNNVELFAQENGFDLNPNNDAQVQFINFISSIYHALPEKVRFWLKENQHKIVNDVVSGLDFDYQGLAFKVFI